MTNKNQNKSQKIRNSFGISHPDIISAHLQMRRLTLTDFASMRIKESADRQKDYYLLPDHIVWKEIEKNGEAICMISFQVRKHGLFAVARLFDPTKTNTRN